METFSRGEDETKEAGSRLKEITFDGDVMVMLSCSCSNLNGIPCFEEVWWLYTPSSWHWI